MVFSLGKILVRDSEANRNFKVFCTFPLKICILGPVTLEYLGVWSRRGQFQTRGSNLWSQKVRCICASTISFRYAVCFCDLLQSFSQNLNINHWNGSNQQITIKLTVNILITCCHGPPIDVQTTKRWMCIKCLKVPYFVSFRHIISMCLLLMFHTKCGKVFGCNTIFFLLSLGGME